MKPRPAKSERGFHSPVCAAGAALGRALRAIGKENIHTHRARKGAAASCCRPPKREAQISPAGHVGKVCAPRPEVGGWKRAAPLRLPRKSRNPFHPLRYRGSSAVAIAAARQTGLSKPRSGKRALAAKARALAHRRGNVSFPIAPGDSPHAPTSPTARRGKGTGRPLYYPLAPTAKNHPPLAPCRVEC
jgi:hypothetical protein